jgi:hypothetical protein
MGSCDEPLALLSLSSSATTWKNRQHANNAVVVVTGLHKWRPVCKSLSVCDHPCDHPCHCQLEHVMGICMLLRTRASGKTTYWQPTRTVQLFNCCRRVSYSHLVRYCTSTALG